MNNLKETIRNIRLLVLDVDGVLTDGSLYYDKNGEHLKKFNVHDGQGIKLAQAYNLEIAVISARGCEIVKNRCTELGIKHIYQHTYDKAKKIKELVSEFKINL